MRNTTGQKVARLARTATKRETWAPGVDKGPDPYRAATGLQIDAGHHRIFEIGRRVKAGELDPDTLIEIVLTRR